MKLLEPYAYILTPINGKEILQSIEACGRVCYKSEKNMTEESSMDFVRNIIKKGHEAVLEHYSFTVRFVCDRGVSHELVRHRIASFCQESTRYCNYEKDDEITVIEPFFLEPGTDNYKLWEASCLAAEKSYIEMIRNGCSPQEARSVLPNSLKTEVIMTANLREWRHFFKLRTAKSAHPQMREITVPLLKTLRKLIPVVFDDIEVME